MSVQTTQLVQALAVLLIVIFGFGVMLKPLFGGANKKELQTDVEKIKKSKIATSYLEAAALVGITAKLLATAGPQPSAWAFIGPAIIGAMLALLLMPSVAQPLLGVTALAFTLLAVDPATATLLVQLLAIFLVTRIVIIRVLG